jgi:hypothetical protein
MMIYFPCHLRVLDEVGMPELWPCIFGLVKYIARLAAGALAENCEWLGPC